MSVHLDLAGLTLALAAVAAPVLGPLFGRTAERFAGDARVSSRWMSLGALAVAGLVGVVAWTAAPPLSWTLASVAVDLVLGWTLLVLAAIDIAALRLPDVFTLPLALAGLGLGGAGGAGLAERLFGACCGFLLLAGIDRVYVRLRGRSGIGLGDAKLFGAAGAWLGAMALPSVLLLAAAGCLIWAAVVMVRRGRSAAAAPLPFGAPLCAAFLTVWLLQSTAPN